MSCESFEEVELFRNGKGGEDIGKKHGRVGSLHNRYQFSLLIGKDRGQIGPHPHEIRKAELLDHALSGRLVEVKRSRGGERPMRMRKVIFPSLSS